MALETIVGKDKLDGAESYQNKKTERLVALLLDL